MIKLLFVFLSIINAFLAVVFTVQGWVYPHSLPSSASSKDKKKPHRGDPKARLAAYRATMPQTEDTRLGAASALLALGRVEECREECLAVPTPRGLALRAVAESDMALWGSAVTALCALRDLPRNQDSYVPEKLLSTYLTECDVAAQSLKSLDTSETTDAWPTMPLWCEGAHRSPSEPRAGMFAKADACAKSAWRYWHKANAKKLSEVPLTQRVAMVDFAVRYACEAVTRDGLGVPLACAIVLGGRAWDILGRAEYKGVCTVLESVHECEHCHFHCIDPVTGSVLNPCIVLCREYCAVQNPAEPMEAETVDYHSGSELLGVARRMLICETLVVLSQCVKYGFTKELQETIGPALRADLTPPPAVLSQAMKALEESMGFAVDPNPEYLIGGGGLAPPYKDFDILASTTSWKN